MKTTKRSVLFALFTAGAAPKNEHETVWVTPDSSAPAPTSTSGASWYTRSVSSSVVTSTLLFELDGSAAENFTLTFVQPSGSVRPSIVGRPERAGIGYSIQETATVISTTYAIGLFWPSSKTGSESFESVTRTRTIVRSPEAPAKFRRARRMSRAVAWVSA